MRRTSTSKWWVTSNSSAKSKTNELRNSSTSTWANSMTRTSWKKSKRCFLASARWLEAGSRTKTPQTSNRSSLHTKKSRSTKHRASKMSMMTWALILASRLKTPPSGSSKHRAWKPHPQKAQNQMTHSHLKQGTGTNERVLPSKNQSWSERICQLWKRWRRRGLPLRSRLRIHRKFRRRVSNLGRREGWIRRRRIFQGRRSRSERLSSQSNLKILKSLK